MATVKIASSRWNESKTHSTNARTWGELKEELGPQILNFEGSPMKAVLRGANGERNVLADSSTLLPQGDYAILLVPEKVKSGDKIVYSVGTLKELKTKVVKLIDFLIEVSEKTDGELSVDDEEEADEVRIDPLVAEAQELEDEY